jgi:hypothetical protein
MRQLGEWFAVRTSGMAAYLPIELTRANFRGSRRA